MILQEKNYKKVLVRYGGNTLFMGLFLFILKWKRLGIRSRGAV